MTPRLAAKIEVSALIRRVERLGGHAAVLARGHGEAGSILLFLADRGTGWGFLERSSDTTGAYSWQRSGPQAIEKEHEISEYVARRRRVDEDLWVLELDIAGVERFAAEMIATG